MKNAKLKSMFIIIIMFIILAISVYSWAVTQNYPSGVWVLDNTIRFNWTPDVNGTTAPYCAVYVNNTGEWSVTATANYTDVPNATHYEASIPVNDSRDTTYGWNVTCDNNNIFNSEVSAVTSFGVDGSVPSITLDSPAANAYLTNLNISLFKYTPEDANNPSNCSFYVNTSGSWGINETNTSWTSGVQDEINLSFNANNHTASNIPDGAYGWNVWCNDTAGNGAWAQVFNRTFIIDSTAPTSMTFSSPPASTVNNDSTPEIIWTATTEINFDRYEIIVANSSNFADISKTITVATRTTVKANLTPLIDDDVYHLKVVAYDKAGLIGNTSTVVNYTLDRITPILTLNAPLNNTYTSDNTIDFNITAVDNNLHTCFLHLFDQTGGGIILNASLSTMPNGTLFNFTTTAAPDGAYYFNLGCNDSVGYFTNVSSSDLNLTVDTTSPTAPNLLSTFHLTNNTDKTPELAWVTTTETNFERYEAKAHYSGNSSIAFESNVTTRTLNYTSMTLTGDNIYFFNVTAYDKAGNTGKSINTTGTTRYYVDPVCGTLSVGWNLCGATWMEARTLTQIGEETSATFVSVWNQSHQWATCNYAASSTGVHCSNTVNINSSTNMSTGGVVGPNKNEVNPAVWIYVNASTEWRNRTWTADGNSRNITLFNGTNGWNLEAGFFRNGRTFGELAEGADKFMTNISMMSLRYNNGTSVPYVNNGLFKKLNNDTIIPFGNAYWIFYNGTPFKNQTWDTGAW